MENSLMEFEQNFVGPVEGVITKAEYGKTPGKGSEYLRLSIEVTNMGAAYDETKYRNPIGFKLQDTLWLPMESDKGDPENPQKWMNKGVRVRKAIVAMGFTGDVYPDAEEFVGCEVGFRLMIDKTSGDPTVAMNSYSSLA